MTTYLELVNKLIRRHNEVELFAGEFTSTRGLYSAIKDGITDTISEINQSKYKWPFNAVEQTQLISSGVSEYAWPSDFQSVDWQSFQIQRDDPANDTFDRLHVIEREEWYRYARDRDYQNRPKGDSRPQYVFSTHGRGFGLSPNPEKDYTVKYRYFKNRPLPVNHDDEIYIPKEFEYVIMAGAQYRLFLFYDNNERAGIALAEKESGIKQMVTNLIGNNFEHVYDGRVKF